MTTWYRGKSNLVVKNQKNLTAKTWGRIPYGYPSERRTLFKKFKIETRILSGLYYRG